MLMYLRKKKLSKIVAAVVSSWASKTSLLLNGNGTNGGQNNTFVDSSSNNLTVTRSGNVTQGSFSPFSPSGWSGYFNGSSDYLTVLGGSVSGNPNAIIEFWINPSQYSSGTVGSEYRTVLESIGGYLDGFRIDITTTGIQFWTAYGTPINSGNPGPTVSFPIPLNKWSHIAISIPNWGNSTHSMYINGALVSTVSGALVRINSVSLNIGRSGSWYFAGMLSNLRIVNSSTVYTANFTPPTAPLTAISGTSLLTLQDNRFKDNSTNNFALTIVGTPKIVASSPFTPSTVYSPSTHGGSAYFDGTGDYLTTPNSTNLQLGSNNFTIEGWVYHTASGGTSRILVAKSDGASNKCFYIGLSTLGIVNWGFSTSGSAWALDALAGSTILTINSWNHLAVTRSGSTFTMWINGVSASTYVNAASLFIGTAPVYVGTEYSASANLTAGYITDVRIINGTALYTTTFTPPTAPLTAITNTQLLLSNVNASIYDIAAKTVVETVGTAQISTATKKFGTGSMKFNGTSDYIKLPSNQDFAFGTGDFTIEAWIYPTSLIDHRTIFTTDGSNSTGIVLSVGAAGTPQIYYGGFYYGIAGSIVVNKWTHIAAVRTSGTLVIFTNGVASTGQTLTTANTVRNVWIGTNPDAAASQAFQGYIDDLRITKAAVYTSTFTPPTLETSTKTDANDPYFSQVALELQANPVQVTTTPWDNLTLIDSSVNGNTVTKVGTPSQGTFSPFSNSGWSVGPTSQSTNYVTAPSNAATALGTGQFTVEGWFKWDATPTGGYTGQLIAGGLLLATPAAGLLDLSQFGNASPAVRATFTPVIGQWYHIAATRNAANLCNIWINGVSAASATSTLNFVQAAWTMGYFVENVHISNFRVVKGTAVYTSAFTPSTTPLTVVSGTGVLCLQDNRFKDNSANNFTLTVTGTPKVQPASPFAATTYSPSVNGGSIYFNGTTDYVSVPSSPVYAFGTGNFTVELFIYPLAAGQFSFVSNNYDWATATGNWAFYTIVGSANLLYFNLTGTNHASSTTAIIPLNQWSHVTYSRVGSTGYFYVNGIQIGTGVADSSNYSGTSGTLFIGDKLNGSGKINGYVSNVRIVNGTAVYTTAFTPPTAPLSPVANTTLLLKGINSGVIDSTGKNSLQTMGTAQASPALFKYGSSSLKFNGSTDYLIIPTSNNFTFGTGDFTIEAWFNSASIASQQSIYGGQAPGYSETPELYIQNSKLYFARITANPIQGTTILTSNTWYHVALVRNSAVTKMYLNGVQEGSSYADTNNYIGNVNRPLIGGYGAGSGTQSFNGYIDDLRVTKGVARYTTTFTPPTSLADNSVGDPYFNSTSLLLKGERQSSTYYVGQNNQFVDSSANALTITRNGNVTQGSFNPYIRQATSALFANGATLTTANNVTISSTYTIEFWIYPTSLPANATWLTFNTANGLLFGIVTNNVYGIGAINVGDAVRLETGVLPTLNAWNHIAIVRSNGKTPVSALWLNGTRIAANLYGGFNLNAPVIIGGSGNTGYFSNIRIEGNVAYYDPTSTTIIPNSLLAPTANTKLLLLSNRSFCNFSSSPNGISQSGSITINTTIVPSFDVNTAYSPALHGGSVYLDGTGDYLTTTASSLPNTGDFTIEAWIYPTSFTSQWGKGIVTFNNGSTARLLLRHTINAGGLNIFYTDGLGTVPFGSSGTNSTLNCITNAWHHVALVRQSGNFIVYLNGVQTINITTQTSLSLVNNLTTVMVGSNTDGTTPEYSGNITDARYIKGTAMYTTAFTPPTAPLTAVANTQLLLNATNAVIYDASSHLPVETMGTAKLSNTQSKFGTSSLYFDGSAGCYAKLPAGSLNFGIQDFTIDFWYYKTVNGATNSRVFQTADGDAILGLGIWEGGGGNLLLGMSSTGSSWDIASSLGTAVMSLNAWHHIVLRRVNTVYTIYIDGVVSNTFISALSVYYNAVHVPVLGGQGSPARNVNCYIDDFRITIGKGRYTVEPTAELTL